MIAFGIAVIRVCAGLAGLAIFAVFVMGVFHAIFASVKADKLSWERYQQSRTQSDISAEQASNKSLAVYGALFVALFIAACAVGKSVFGV